MVALGYAAGGAPDAALALVRTVGLLAVVLAPVRLLAALVLWWQQLRFGTRALGEGVFLHGVVLSLLGVGLIVLQFAAGLGCWRATWRGRRLLVIWAWSSLAYAGYAVLANSYFLLAKMGSRGRIDPSTAAYYITTTAERSLSWAVVAVVALVLLTRPAVVDALRHRAGGGTR